ncbi:5,6-dimethylbenzimidazole synthase [Brucellaceae bacterium C25G]
MHFTANDQQSLINIMQWRRDVRHFKSDIIPPELIDELQRAVFLSPSVGNARPWRIFRVESRKLRDAVYNDFRQENLNASALYNGERSQEYSKLKLEALQTAPLQLAIFTDQNPVHGHGLGRQTLPVTLEQSTAMAVQNLNLVARSHGLGVGMVSILNPENMIKAFNVPPNWSFSFYLCIGWPDFISDTPLLHQIGWQENTDQEWAIV